MTTTRADQPGKYRNSECRYCERYGTACGREHGEDTRADWSRSWNGHADQPTGTTYTAALATSWPRCDWCDHLAVAIVTNCQADGYTTRDWMCSQHLAEYHPTLTVTH